MTFEEKFSLLYLSDVEKQDMFKKQQKNISDSSISLSFFLLLCNVFLLLCFFLAVLYLLSLQNNTTTLRSNLQIQGDVLRQVNQRISSYFDNASKHLMFFYNLLSQQFFGTSELEEDVFFSFGENFLKIESEINAIYFGNDKGDFYMVKRIIDGGGQKIGRKKVINDGGKIIESWSFSDGAKMVYYPEFLVNSLDDGYDPRTRDWYKNAQDTENAWYGPYPSFTDETVGMTGSVKLSYPGGITGVVGIDIDINRLSYFLKKLPFAKTGSIVIKNPKGELIAISDRTNKNYSLTQIKFDVASNTQFVALQGVSELDSSPEMKLFSKKILSLTSKELESFSTWKQNFLDKLLTIFFPRSSKSLNIRNILLQGIIYGDIFLNEKEYLFTYQPLKLFGDDITWQAYTLTDALSISNSLEHLSKIITYIFIFFMLFIIVVLQNVSRTITIPLSLLSQMMNNFSKRLALDVSFKNSSIVKISEIENIGSVYNNLQNGFRSFKKFVPDVVVRRSMSNEPLDNGMDKRNICILFSDIEGFTSISERTNPEVLCQCLDIYFSMMTEQIGFNNGLIDKFIGDAIMALFGALGDPQDDRIIVQNAITAALGMQRKMIEIDKKIQEIDSGISIRTRVGISMGESMVGIMGSKERLNFTALGDRVNLASRLEAINKEYGTTLIVSEKSKLLTEDIFFFRYLGCIRVRGKIEAEKIYEPIGLLDEISENEKNYYINFGNLQSILEKDSSEQSRSKAVKLMSEHFSNISDPAFERILKKYGF